MSKVCFCTTAVVRTCPTHGNYTDPLKAENALLHRVNDSLQQRIAALEAAAKRVLWAQRSIHAGGHTLHKALASAQLCRCTKKISSSFCARKGDSE